MGQSTNHAHQLGFIRRYVFSADHKVVGIQYFITGVLMAIIGGYLSYVFRMKLGFGQGVDGYEVPLFGAFSRGEYNSFISAHGLIMILWFAMPVIVAAFGNLLIPLMIGCDDMAYPKLNMLSYWVFLLSSLVMVASFFVGDDGTFGGGWTMYPPLSSGLDGGASYSPSGQLPPFLSGGNLVIVAVALEFIAFLIGGVNFLVTTIVLRAPGMTLWRMPLFVWMVNLATLIFMFSVGPLIAGAVMLLFERTLGSAFFDPRFGGDPILFQHLFWFFGHPEVYVIFLPALGIIAEILPSFSRKPIFGYKMIVWACIVASFLSFLVWAHHQFISGIDPKMASFFSATTIAISIPFAVVLFCYIATLRGGSIILGMPMLWTIGFMGTFLVGGVTGVYLGSSAFDIIAHDTYFVVAHFHYTLIPAVVFGGMAGVYYWYPKFIGRLLSERLGKIHFYGSLVAFTCIFLPLFIPGLAGEHRRIYDYSVYPTLAQYAVIREIATVATIVFWCMQSVFFFNLVYSFFRGKKAVANPWSANTLEWVCDSPPPHGNFDEYPTVYRGPYEYSVPGKDKDFWPQNERS